MKRAVVDYEVHGTVSRDTILGERISATIHPEGNGQVIVDDGREATVYRTMYRVQVTEVPEAEPVPVRNPLMRPAGWCKPVETPDEVLRQVLSHLDGWIETAQENHVALDHRGESIGDECWLRFHPSDIRRIVNDVARALGIKEFPEPDAPVENRPYA